jgi:hypothetical protein
MTEEIDQQINLLNQNESVKLFKNTKGYNWEIRILSTDLDRLQQLDDDMRKRWGGLTDEI